MNANPYPLLTSLGSTTPFEDSSIMDSIQDKQLTDKLDNNNNTVVQVCKRLVTKDTSSLQDLLDHGFDTPENSRYDKKTVRPVTYAYIPHFNERYRAAKDRMVQKSVILAENLSTNKLEFFLIFDAAFLNLFKTVRGNNKTQLHKGMSALKVFCVKTKKLKFGLAFLRLKSISLLVSRLAQGFKAIKQTVEHKNAKRRAIQIFGEKVAIMQGKRLDWGLESIQHIADFRKVLQTRQGIDYSTNTGPLETMLSTWDDRPRMLLSLIKGKPDMVRFCVGVTIMKNLSQSHKILCFSALKNYQLRSSKNQIQLKDSQNKKETVSLRRGTTIDKPDTDGYKPTRMALFLTKIFSVVNCHKKKAFIHLVKVCERAAQAPVRLNMIIHQIKKTNTGPACILFNNIVKKLIAIRLLQGFSKLKHGLPRQSPRLAKSVYGKIKDLKFSDFRLTVKDSSTASTGPKTFIRCKLKSPKPP